MTTLDKLITQRNKIAEKIKKLQKERKRINNAISQAKYRNKLENIRNQLESFYLEELKKVGLAK